MEWPISAYVGLYRLHKTRHEIVTPYIRSLCESFTKHFMHVRVSFNPHTKSVM